MFDTAVGRVGVYICYDRHFPEGWRELGLNNAQIVFNPSATKPGLSNRLWEIEQPAAAADNQYFIAANNRIGKEIEEFGDEAVQFYGSSYFVDPRGNFVGDVASTGQGGDRDPRPRPRRDHPGPQRLAVLPRPPARVLRQDHCAVRGSAE